MTKYEVYNKKTGEAIRRRSSGTSVLFDYRTPATMMIIAVKDPNNLLYNVLHGANVIPDDADLGVRVVNTEVLF